MKELTLAPYGSWKSPISSESIVAGTIGLSEVTLAGSDIYWLETRPTEGGRYVVVKRSADGQVTDVTPPSFNARTRVHEYGGGAYTVVDGVIYFSHFTDQRLYRQPPGSAPQPLTPPLDFRYADFAFDAIQRRLICVREDHTAPGREAENCIVALNILVTSEKRGASGSGGGADPGGAFEIRSCVHVSPCRSQRD